MPRLMSVMNVPSSSTQSLSSTKRVILSLPIAPSYRPTNSGCVSEITLLPSIVVVIGISQPSARASSSSCRAKRCSSTPPTITGPLAVGQPALGFGHRFGQHFRLAGEVGILEAMRHLGHDGHHVARNLDVDRPLVTGRGVQHAVDLVESGLRIGQLGAGDAQFFKDVVLRAEVAHAMVQERIVVPLLQARRTGDDYDRRLFGIGPGHAVAQAQAPHAIGDAHRPHAMHPGIGVGGKAGQSSRVVVTTSIGLRVQHRVELQHVIARDAEHVADAVVLQAANQVLADRQARDRRRSRRTQGANGRDFSRHGTRPLLFCPE